MVILKTYFIAFNAMDPYTDNIVLMVSIQLGTWQDQCQELIIYMMLWFTYP